MDLSIKLKLDDSGLAGQAQAAAGQITAAAQQTAGGMGDLNAAVRQAHGGMGVLNGATAMASGSLQGMAGGAVQAANGMRLLGMSLKAAMDATLVLALAGAIYALVQKIREARREAEELQKQFRLDNLALAVDGATRQFDSLLDRMERAAGLAKGLDEAGRAAQSVERERQLAELERDRNKQLASGADADAVNKAFDAKRRQLEFSFRREDSAAAVAGWRGEMSGNDDRAKALREQANRLTELSWGQEGEAQNKTLQQVLELEKQIAALADANKILAAKIDAEGGRAEVIDLQEEAAALAASIPEKSKEEAGKAAKEPSGSWGSLQTASDRLARIGGFVGGSNMVQNQAREQLQVARRQQQLLEQIERNTSQGGQGAAILA